MTRQENNSSIKWIKGLILTIICAVLFNAFIFSSAKVEGISMEPTLFDDDRVIFNKFIYLVAEPERGDIVMINKHDENYVKRVIALPGEKIEMTNHKLYINNEKQFNSYVDRNGDILTGSFGPKIVPKNHYFVMGDNRAVSKDSRNGLGLIKREEIIGRSEFTVYPLRQFSRTK